METPYQQASAFITAHRTALAVAIVDYHYSLQPEFWQKFGEAGRLKSLRDEEYHLAYLAEALATADLSLFLEYLQWCKVFFTGLRFPEEAIRVTFECMRELLCQQLPAELAPIVVNYLDAGLAHLARMPATLPSFLPDGAPLVDVSRPYLQALLRGDRAEASRLILHAVEHGAAVKEVYLHVFQPSRLEIGRLWQTNQISVAQEHYCTAATQMIMSQLYPYLFSTDKHGRTLVITCVGEELHEIGARMVADFFELDGWDTYYLGANVPTESVLRTLAERKADLLAISATITPHVHGVSELITRVRASRGSQVKIMVGGYPFNVMPTLWQQVGADGYARDAEDAITVGNGLTDTVAP
jgi:methanogenic corrinoid protein MtbC1